MYYGFTDGESSMQIFVTDKGNVRFINLESEGIINSYFNLSVSEIDDLIEVLQKLKPIAEEIAENNSENE